MNLPDIIGEIMFLSSFGSPLAGLLYFKRSKNEKMATIIISILISFVLWIGLLYGSLAILFRNGLPIE